MTAPIFLDYASATPQSDASIAAMQPYMQQYFYNASALYLSAKKVKHDLDDLRAAAAKVLQVRPSEVYFTAGATEANNIVIKGILAKNPGTHCIYSDIEHDSVRNCMPQVDAKIVPVLADGRIHIDELKNAITDKTSLIICMYANNEIGTIQPIQEIATLAQTIRSNRVKNGISTPLYVHVDASQSFQYIPLLPHKLGIDSAVIGSGKIYGPKQSAVLFVKAGTHISPILHGGGQENSLRPGTENVALIAGTVTAFQQADALRADESKRMKDLQHYFIEKISQLPQVTINGSLKHRIPNNVHVTCEGYDNETLVMQLDELGIMAATGSACHASNDEPSAVLRAICLSDDQSRRSIRFSMGRDTTKKDIDTTVTALAKCLRS